MKEFITCKFISQERMATYNYDIRVTLAKKTIRKYQLLHTFCQTMLPVVIFCEKNIRDSQKIVQIMIYLTKRESMKMFFL